jgi:hypothetical protein
MGKKQAVKTAQPAPALPKEDLATQVLCTQQHQAELYEAIMARGREEAYSLVKEAISRSLEKGKTALLKEGYEKGLKEGEEHGRTVEQEKWETKHERVKVDESIQTEPTTRVTTNTSSQTTPTCIVDASMQTVPNGEPLRLLNDAGMSTELPSTCETGIQANETPTSLSTPPLRAMSLLTIPSQLPSATSTLPSMLPTTLTTTTNTSFPASNQPPAPRKRRHTLPDRPTTPQPSLQPPELPLEPRRFAATSPQTTAATPTATTVETAARAVFSTTTATTTSETATHASYSPQRRSTARQTALYDVVRTRSSERVVRSTERLRQPNHPQ